MNIWADELMKKTVSVTPVRGPTEPPVPGYSGFIPRVENTDAGLARRFHDAAKRGLETFRAECSSHEDRLREPMTGINTNPHLERPPLALPSDRFYSSRIFRKEGMIPDYEGHIHGFKFQVGKNFGNTTRDLEVCAHSYPSYGEYTKDKDLIEKYLPPY